jgi:uncharacterized protein YecE (DUF72 family)
MIKVGCCGFPTSVERYFESFSLVELNSTFYHYPQVKTVEGWRVKAPGDFEFSVKAHQDISYKARLKTGELSVQAFDRMRQVCRTLNSRMLLIQTPGSFRPDKLADAEVFFKATNREGLCLIWETRGPAWEGPENRRKLEHVLKNLDVTHVTDPFRIMPVYTSNTAYFRLHGSGKQMYYYQYSDEELRRLKEIVRLYEDKAKEVYILFNNLAMFEDGIRFKKYLSEGAFQRISSSTALATIKSVLEKIRYPVSKSVLIEKLGWRLLDVGDGKQI